MTEIKILAKKDGIKKEQFGMIYVTLYKFISQETETENGKEVPKWEILVDWDHPKIKELEENRINFGSVYGNPVKNENYSYEISFIDWDARDEGKTKIRAFGEDNENITIKDNSYSAKIEQLKNQTNLMREEEKQWKAFISDFRQEVSQVEDKNSAKYKEGKKFIEDLESELNKKTGKGNDDTERERERERERDKKIEKLRRKIAKLEKKVNKTPQEEQELKDKKEELAKLEREKQEQNPNQNNQKNWWPWIVGGGVLLGLVAIIIYFFTRGKEKKA